MPTDPHSEPTGHALRNREAFAEFVRRNTPRVLAYCQERVPDRQAAEDAAQEALFRFYRQTTAGHAPQKPLGWLLAIARNCCLEMQRTLAKHKPAHPTDACRVDRGPTTLDQPTFAELIEGLSEADQTLLRLKHMDGLRCREIAEETNRAVGTVTSSLARIYKTLRAEVLAREHS